MIKGFFLRFRFLVKAVFRNIFVPEVPNNIDVLVVSPGGVATTSLIEHLNRFVRTNDAYDRDGFKHLPRPSRSVRRSSKIKVVYITADPIMAYQSINRRKWLLQQSSKLGLPLAILSTERAAAKQFMEGVKKQRKLWREAEISHFLELDYNGIWSDKEKLAVFLGVTAPAFLGQFPVRRNRLSEPCADGLLDGK